MCKNNLPLYDPKRCFLFALGRNAIYAACQILGLRSGDEVLTPAFDCDGSLQPFRALGLKLIFFRSDPNTFSVDIDDIKRKITPKTKLIHIINHFGMPQPWDSLLAMRQKAGIPILEDNAYSLFSGIGDRLLGAFGDMAIFSLRKNLPLIDGGMLCLNNLRYEFRLTQKKAKYCYPTEYPQVLRLAVRKMKLWAFFRQGIKMVFPVSEAPPPLPSQQGSDIACWPPRDVTGKEFSCDYLRPMSGLARKQLGSFSQADFIQISEKKRYYYAWLAQRLKTIAGVEVLWPDLPGGAVPFCISCIFDSKRDIFLETLRKKYEVMSWPTLSREILDRLDDFPEIKLLGRKILQINLPADKVRLPNFGDQLENLVKDITKISNGISLDKSNR